MKEFKVGDKVYFPMVSNEVFILKARGSDTYPLIISEKSVNECFTASGSFYESGSISCLFHATQENKELLEALYGVEFESPPPKTRTVTFEMPETFNPHHGENYWFIFASASDGVKKGTNQGCIIDDFRIRNGVWRTKEEALMVANTIFNIEKDS